MISTLIEITLLVLGIAFVVYIFNSTPDMFKGAGKGTCSEEDYEIADKLAERKN